MDAFIEVLTIIAFSGWLLFYIGRLLWVWFGR